MSDLSSVIQPLNTARGLPNEHYVDQDTFEEERTSVLFANWSAIGFGKDVPTEGDANPVDFLGMPLLIVRDHSGDVRVYQNTCRHRGMILVQEKGNIRGTIRCPYHSWCYGLDGRLRSTPPTRSQHGSLRDCSSTTGVRKKARVSRRGRLNATQRRVGLTTFWAGTSSGAATSQLLLWSFRLLSKASRNCLRARRKSCLAQRSGSSRTTMTSSWM